jgi:DNA-binding NarL/FixJ family response regulator
MNNKISILIVDDHAVVRAGLRALMRDRSDMEVAGEVADGGLALSEAIRLKPNLVLMDIAMPGMDGIEATRRIRDQVPGTNILILTAHDDEEFFFPALKAGASGYIVKGTEPEELFYAIRTAASGRPVLSPVVARTILDGWLAARTATEETDYQSLTAREKEVMQLMAAGNGTRDMACRLFLSVRTVEKHRQSMMDKLNLRSAVDVYKYAARKGITGPPTIESSTAGAE